MKILQLSMVLITSILLVSCTDSNTNTQNTVPTTTTKTVSTLPIQPEKKVDIYGKILSMEWNEISVMQVDTSKDPTFNMTPEAKKKYMQAMDEGARTALKEQINTATLGEVKLTIPVGIPMIRKTAQWPDAPNTEASLADLKSWQYISVWLSSEVKDQKIAEFVKIAYTQ